MFYAQSTGLCSRRDVKIQELELICSTLTERVVLCCACSCRGSLLKYGYPSVNTENVLKLHLNGAKTTKGNSEADLSDDTLGWPERVEHVLIVPSAGFV